MIMYSLNLLFFSEWTWLNLTKQQTMSKVNYLKYKKKINKKNSQLEI